MHFVRFGNPRALIALRQPTMGAGETKPGESYCAIRDVRHLNNGSSKSSRERPWWSSAGLRLYVPISACVFLRLLPFPHYISNDSNNVLATGWRSAPANVRDLSALRGRTCIQLAENED
jgi:hypothetical protein